MSNAPPVPTNIGTPLHPNLPLNAGSICATAGSQTASAAPTCFGRSDGSSTITMTPTPTSSEITYTVDGGASTPGTLVAGSFTVSGLTAGEHTIVVTGSGTCTTPLTVGVTTPVGNQPAAPTGLACYETATFSSASCTWIVSGTQPAAPTGLAC